MKTYLFLGAFSESYTILTLIFLGCQVRIKTVNYHSCYVVSRFICGHCTVLVC